MALDHTKTRRTSWNIKLGGTDLGGIDAVDLSGIKTKLAPIKVGTAGDVVLDDRVIGLEDGSSFTFEFRETKTWATMKLLFPWLAATTDLQPIGGILMSTLAVACILHPVDMGATITEDILLYKVVPIQGYAINRDGMKDDSFKVTCKIYPDVSKIGTAANAYGKIGAAS